MNILIGGFVTAFSLYSAIPMPRIQWNSRNMRYALCFFPLIGAVTGVAELLWYQLSVRLGIVPGLYGAVATLLPILISGGIHMDGFMDTWDAQASHAPREKKLDILKDPHMGAFGALFCAGQLLLSFGLWQQLYGRPQLIILVAAGYIVARSCNALTIAIFPTAKNSGLVHAFADSAAKRVVIVTCGVWMALVVALFLGTSLLWGGVAVAACGLYFLLHRRFCLREFGGNTGDLAGFLLQNIELLLLAVAVLGGLLA